MGARHVWRRSVKCLRLIAGVSFARLTPSSARYFVHSLPARAVSFPSRKFSETPATQARDYFRIVFMLYETVNKNIVWQFFISAQLQLMIGKSEKV